MGGRAHVGLSVVTALCAWSGASSAAGWSDSRSTASCTRRGRPSTSCCAASSSQPGCWASSTWPAGAWSSGWVTETLTTRTWSPYSHGRHDADKGQLGASIQFDLVPKGSKSQASVPGRGKLKAQPVTHYYDDGCGLSDGRAVDHHHKPDAVELLRRRHAEAHPVQLDYCGAGPSDLRHCYMCETRDSGRWYYWPPKPKPKHARSLPAHLVGLRFLVVRTVL
jgi:hypothetical protein